MCHCKPPLAESVLTSWRDVCDEPLFDQLARFRVHLDESLLCHSLPPSNVILRDYRVVLGDYIGKQNPAIRGFPGFPFCLCDLGPLLGAMKKAEERSSKSRKCLPSAEGFVRCARPKGLRAPWNPGGGAPCTACLTSASGGPAGGLSPRAGCRGRAPPTPCRQAWVAPVASGAVSSPLRGCGPHQPLDPPFTRKTRQRPAQGRRALPEWMGVKARAATAQRLGLDAQERPHAPGWWLGCFSPAACHVANAPGGPPEALLICSCFARFRRNN